MEIFDSIITLIKDSLWETIGIILAYLSLIVPIRQYLNQRKLEEKDKRFTNFHRLVKEFVEPDSQTGTMKLDRQIAIAFEYRNYPEYFDLTARALEDLKKQWRSIPGTERLVTEMDLTLQYIKFRKKLILIRLMIKLLGKRP